MNDTAYVVITPARNEEDHIEKTLISMISQNIRPRLWVIVDDGSSDDTAEIVGNYVDLHSWIRLVQRQDRGFRKQGGGVVETFYAGYPHVSDVSWDYIVKFDGDLSFEPDYFQRIFEYFEKEPDLGLCGGLIHNTDGNKSWIEKDDDPDFHVRGATKIYRRACWDDIGELVRAPGWDSLDELKANSKGWKTKTVRDVPIVHHRFTGSADGTWSNSRKNGLANYISGYHPLFMLVKCARRLFKKPYLVDSAGLLWGFAGGYLKRVDQVPDPDLITYVRSQQIRRLTFRDSIWSK